MLTGRKRFLSNACRLTSAALIYKCPLCMDNDASLKGLFGLRWRQLL